VVNLESGTLSLNKAPRQRSKKAWTGAAAQLSLVLMLTLACLVTLAGCGGVQGTYADPTGSMTVELKSGGVATISLMGQISQCTYTSASNQVTVNCKDDSAGKIVFTVQSDGTLTGPSGSFFPPLKKK
jgi:hypothetical protein